MPKIDEGATDRHEHQTDDTTSTAEPSTDSTVGDPADPARANDRPMVRRGAKIGAVTAVSSMFLALALSGSSTGGQPTATPTTETEPEAAAPVLRVGSADRAIAKARSDRSANRTPVPAKADPKPKVAKADPQPKVVGRRYVTVGLNVRTRPDEDAKVITVLDRGDKVRITDSKEDGWREVLYKGETRWVKARFLSKHKPKPRPSGPSSAACPAGSGGSGMENGLSANAVKVHRAVCAEFPSVSTYGGTRGGGGNHGTGHAVDIMISGGTGDAIAAYVRAHAGELGVTEVIWEQRIWTTQRASAGWRGMSDRGSATDNHYDHVHVTVG